MRRQARNHRSGKPEPLHEFGSFARAYEIVAACPDPLGWSGLLPVSIGGIGA